MEKNTALSIDSLSFKFSPRLPFFFKNLSCSFSSNTIHFIQGKNGSGKSTLFRILRGNILSLNGSALK